MRPTRSEWHGLDRLGALDKIRLLLGLNLSRRPVFTLILIGDTYFLDAMRLQSQRALYSRYAEKQSTPRISACHVETMQLGWKE